jgi:hypothetical protein
LCAAVKDIFQCTAVLGRASVTKQLDGRGWNRQQERGRDCGEAGMMNA